MQYVWMGYCCNEWNGFSFIIKFSIQGINDSTSVKIMSLSEFKFDLFVASVPYLI